MTRCLSRRSRDGAIPAEAVRRGAEGSGCPLAPPGKHDEQRLFARSRGEHPRRHSQVSQSAVCTDGPGSLNSRRGPAAAHQEEFRRTSGGGDLKEQPLRAWVAKSWQCRGVPGAGAAGWAGTALGVLRCCHWPGTQDRSLLLCTCVQSPRAAPWS